MAAVIRQYSDRLYPTRDGDALNQPPSPLTEAMYQHPVTALIASALSQAQIDSAFKNAQQTSGGDSGKVIGGFAKDLVKNLPKKLRGSLINMVASNAVIPFGKKTMTFAPNESGVDVNLSNAMGGDMTLSVDPKFVGLKYQRQF